MSLYNFKTHTPVTAEMILRKWKGVDYEYLRALVFEQKLSAYHGYTVNLEGKDLFKGKKYDYQLFELDDRIQDAPAMPSWNEIVFDLADIIKYQEANLEVLATRVFLNERDKKFRKGEPRFITNPEEWISADKIRLQLGMSNYDFCGLLSSDNYPMLQTDREKERDDFYYYNESVGAQHYFENRDIATLSVHVNYYRAYCEYYQLEPVLVAESEYINPDNLTFLEALLKIKDLESQFEEMQSTDTAKSKQSVNKMKNKMTAKEFYKKIPMIVVGAFKVADEWKELKEDDPRQVDGFKEGDIRYYSQISGSDELIAAFKDGLEESDKVKVRRRKGASLSTHPDAKKHNSSN